MPATPPRSPAEARALLGTRTRLRDGDRAAVLAVIEARGAQPVSLVSDRALVDQAARLLERPAPPPPGGGGGGVPVPVAPPPVVDDWRPAGVPPPPPEPRHHSLVVELVDPWEGTGREPPPVGERHHARQYRFRGAVRVGYHVLTGATVADPVPEDGAVAFRAPTRGLPVHRVGLTAPRFDAVRGVFLWVDPPGAAAPGGSTPTTSPGAGSTSPARR